MYLTREQAIAELTGPDSLQDAQSAGALLDSALTLWPQCARTNYWMIAGYPAGTDFGSVGGRSTEDLFTVSRW